MKFLIFFLFLLFITLSYSQQICTDESDCTDGPLDPICQSSTPECINSVCVYEQIPNCCTTNDECASLDPAPCVSQYQCNADTNQCEPILKECENGQACTDFCVDDELTCETRRCVASDDSDIDSTCQIGTVNFECEPPQNKCLTNYCLYGEGCEPYDEQCSDYIGCTNDVCASAEIGCTHTPIDNCIECYGEGCVTEDACLPSLCVPYELLRGDGPGFYCKIIPINCTTEDPCLINGVCINGECEYENICSSEVITATTTSVSTIATTATTTATTTSETISGPITTIATTASTVATSTGSITLSSTLGSSESEEYKGPKYPNCLGCKDLNCERMGRRCKYLKSYNKNCYEDDHQEKNFKHKHQHKHEHEHEHEHKHKHKHEHENEHHNNPHHENNNQHHQNNNQHHQSIGHYNSHQNQHQKDNGGYGHQNGYENEFNKNDNEEFYNFNNIKYPRKLGPFDCCPYTPTCY